MEKQSIFNIFNIILLDYAKGSISIAHYAVQFKRRICTIVINVQDDVDMNKIQGSKRKFSNKSGVMTWFPSLCHTH